jgi:hypothetical protein
VQQFPFADFQLKQALVLPRGLGQATLHADEFTARIAMLVQPVGISQARIVGSGVIENGAEEFGVSHEASFRHPGGCAPSAGVLQLM